MDTTLQEHQSKAGRAGGSANTEAQQAARRATLARNRLKRWPQSQQNNSRGDDRQPGSSWLDLPSTHTPQKKKIEEEVDREPAT